MIYQSGRVDILLLHTFIMYESVFGSVLSQLPVSQLLLM